MAENELKVGDTVYGNFGKYGRVDVREGKVVKVTPTGRVNVDFGRRAYGDNSQIIQQFKDGREVGGDYYHAVWLIDRDRYEELLDYQREQDAVKALTARLNKWRFNSKAEALALADEIKALAEAIPDSYGATT